MYRTLKALKTNRWTKIFFNNRGEVDLGDGDFEAQAIPESYSDSPAGKYKTVGELVKGYENTSKLIGAKGVIIPGENAPAEEVDKYYNSLGRPEKPEGYKYDPLSDLHPEMKMTPETEAGFNKFVHKHGLTQKQAVGVRAEYYGAISQSLSKRDEATTKSKQEAIANLMGEWGAEYDTNVKRTQSMIEKFGGEGARDAFGDLGNNPAVLKTLATIAGKFSEDTFTLGNTQNEGSVSDAQKKILAILQDKDHMFHKTGVGHAEAVQEMLKLHTIANPTG